MKKTLQETVYRDIFKNERWRFLRHGKGSQSEKWVMVRIKDGHWMYFCPAHLVLEGP
jgi:hypothetical protein